MSYWDKINTSGEAVQGIVPCDTFEEDEQEVEEEDDSHLYCPHCTHGCEWCLMTES
jgi:hypothetical protein